MNTETTDKIRPKSYEHALTQAKTQDLLNQILKEFGNIASIAACPEQQKNLSDSRLALGCIFQHSQNGLNAAHELKNTLSNQQSTGVKYES